MPLAIPPAECGRGSIFHGLSPYLCRENDRLVGPKEELQVEQRKIYEDIALRTEGDIYIGVVGPVRTGKSTFIKRFMETMVIPNIDNVYRRERSRDELPQSGSGRTIMTAEPKFVPEEAVEVTLENGAAFSVRLIDCVGYMVPGAVGSLEDGSPRMVTTPWFDYEIPMTEAAEIGTRKVIAEHSTIGIVVTTDGTITDIPREDYLEAEERVITELKELGKPFLVVLNSAYPNSDRAQSSGPILFHGMTSPVCAPIVWSWMSGRSPTSSRVCSMSSRSRSWICFCPPGWTRALRPSHQERTVRRHPGGLRRHAPHPRCGRRGRRHRGVRYGQQRPHHVHQSGNRSGRSPDGSAAGACSTRPCPSSPALPSTTMGICWDFCRSSPMSNGNTTKLREPWRRSGAPATAS